MDDSILVFKEIRRPIEAIFFWSVGLCCLIVWNSIMSLSAFWQESFDSETNSYYPFVYMSGALVAFFSFDAFNRYFSFWLRIYGIPFLLIQFFMLMGTVQYISFLNKTAMIIIFYIIIFLLGFTNELFQFTLARYVSCFGYKPIAEYNAGSSLSGIIISALSLFQQIPNMQPSTALIFNQILVGLSQVICLAIFGLYFKFTEVNWTYNHKKQYTWYASAQTHAPKNSNQSKYGYLKGRSLEETNSNLENLSKSITLNKSVGNEECASPMRNNILKKTIDPFMTHIQNVDLECVREVSAESNTSTNLRSRIDSYNKPPPTHKDKAKKVLKEIGKPQDQKHIAQAFGSIKKIQILNFLQFIITFIVYPNYIFHLNLGTKAGWSYPLTVMVFGIFDFAGKLLNTFFTVNYSGGFVVLCQLRIQFVPQIFFSYFYKENWVFSSVLYGYLLVGLFAFSNGFCISTCFSLAATINDKSLIKVAMYLMIASMFIGITIGCSVPLILASFNV